MMGSTYPLWVEKLVFIGLIAGAVYAGMMLQDHISGIGLHLTRFCGLPIAVLVLTEGFGRVLQSRITK